VRPQNLRLLKKNLKKKAPAKTQTRQQAAKSPVPAKEDEKPVEKGGKPPAGKGPAKAAPAKSPAPVQEPEQPKVEEKAPPKKQQQPAKSPTPQEPKPEPEKKAPGEQPAKTEPAKTEPAKTEPAKTEPAKTEPAKSAKEQPKAQPAKEQPKAQPAKEQPKAQPAKTETAKAPAKTQPKDKQPAKKDAEKPKADKPKAEPKKQAAGQKRKGPEVAEGGKEPPKRPPVPETLKKKREYRKKLAIEWAALRSKEAKERKALRVEAYKRAERYDREYKKEEKDLINNRRIARNTGSFFVDPEPKIAIVIRIRGIMGVSPKVKKILRLLRLRQLHNATFVKLTPPMVKMLKLVEPYIAYGYPTLTTVRQIIYKRGYASIKGQRIRITDNSLINKNLKKFNIICVEDIIHEIYTCGKSFKHVNKWLWPFKLNPPRGGFVKKRVHFTEGGDAGNREKYINRLVRKMI